jgi:hypothetical protein
MSAFARSRPEQVQQALLLDHLVYECEQICWHSETECLAVLRLMASSEAVGCWTGRLAGFSP